jgi:NADPH:quinone reductase
MRAIVMAGYGGPEVLRSSDVPMVTPASGEVLVKVVAAAVNPADSKWRSGMFASFMPLSFPHVLGYDIAGIVAGGDGLPIGMRVAAMLDPIIKGGYAEFAVAKLVNVAAIPDNLSFVNAAAIPTAGLTGTQMVERAANVQAGDLVLITGATGAVGRFALHAALKRGARIVAAVRAGRGPTAMALGADETIALGEEDWNGSAFDHVIDTVGGGAVAALCRKLKPGGRIVTAATTPIEGEGLPAIPLFFAVEPDGPMLEKLAGAVARHEIALPAPLTMKLAEAAEAQRRTDAGGLDGKIVLLT